MTQDLERLYQEAKQALAAKEYDRATEALKQILMADENYKDASRLLAQVIRIRRRRWYNDMRLWGPVIGVAAAGLLLWLAPKMIPPAQVEATMTLPANSPTAPVATSTPGIPTSTPAPTATAIPLAWRRIGMLQEFPRDTITAIVVDPDDPDVLYVGTENAGIYKSIDGGASWRPSSSGIADGSIQEIRIDPFSPDILWALTLRGVYYQTVDGGISWQRSEDVWDQVFDPSDAQHRYRIHGDDLLESTDRGISWNVISSGCPNPVDHMAIHPGDPQVLYAASSACLGIYKSTDGGHTWVELEGDWENYSDQKPGTPLYSLDGIYLGRDGQGKDVLYVLGSNHRMLIVIYDDGRAWESLGGCHNFLVDPLHPEVAFCDLRTTSDGGRSWQLFNSYYGGRPMNITAMVYSHAGTTHRLWMAMESGLFLSTDRGATLEEHNNGLPGKRIELDVNPYGSGALFLSGSDFNFDLSAVLFISLDNAKSWFPLPESQTSHPAFDAAGDAIYANFGYFLTQGQLEQADDALLISRDNGMTWQLKDIPGLGAIYLLAADPVISRQVYILHGRGDGQYDLMVSTDAGKTWSGQQIEITGLTGSHVADIADQLFAGTDQVLYATIRENNQIVQIRNDGGTWTTSNCAAVDGEWTDLLIDPADNRSLLLATRGDGILASDDGCQTWQPRFFDVSVNSLASDPNHPDTIYAGADSGAYISFDRGATWNSINDGLLGATVIYAIVVDGESHVFATTPYGIFVLESK